MNYRRILLLTILLFASLAATAQSVSIVGTWALTATDELLLDSALRCPELPATLSDNLVSVQQLRVPPKAVKEFTAGLKMRTARPDAAISRFQKAIKFYPSYSSAYVQMGLALMDKRQWEAAETTIRKAIAIDSNSSEANTALGILLNRRRQFEKSEPVLRRALQLDPGSASAHYELALSYWGVHAFRRVACEALLSVESEPKFAPSHVLLGAALMKRNLNDLAREQLREAQLLDPRAQSILDALERLGSQDRGNE